MASIQKSALDLTPWQQEYRVQFCDAELRWQLGNALPERQADGATLWHGFVTDITDRKTAEIGLALEASRRAEADQRANEALTHCNEEKKRRAVELSSMAEMAHAANRAKSAFLANMSYETRTPMSGVIGMLDMLQQTRMDSEQSHMLATVQKWSVVLLNMLNDVLDFSKIEAGQLIVECVPTHLRELLQDVTQLMVGSCNAKSIELSLYVSPALPPRIMTDPTRLRQVLLNLLGNAVKFTSSHMGKPAKVMLRVEPCTLAQGQAGIRLRVIDSGIGISPEVQDKLFQPFMQADAGTAREFGGTGLGLSISRRLVELMGGNISVRSALGEGSEFRVELAHSIALSSGEFGLKNASNAGPTAAWVSQAAANKRAPLGAHPANTQPAEQDPALSAESGPAK